MDDDTLSWIVISAFIGWSVAFVTLGVFTDTFSDHTDDYERLCGAVSGEVLDLEGTLACFVDGEILGKKD